MMTVAKFQQELWQFEFFQHTNILTLCEHYCKARNLPVSDEHKYEDCSCRR